MAPQVFQLTDPLLTGRANRRRFLAGIGAAALMPAAVAAEALMTMGAQDQGGAIVARQSDEAAATNVRYLTAPGARLYYTVSGSGPVLLLIPQGGPMDADSYAPIVGPLAEHYTVVRYDTRGMSRSRRDDPVEDVPVEVHADDARRLLMAIGDEPAYVLGSSGGAVIGLALVERHPELVQTLVAHEPPLVELLPEDSEHRTANQEIYDAYLQGGSPRRWRNSWPPRVWRSQRRRAI